MTLAEWHKVAACLVCAGIGLVVAASGDMAKGAEPAATVSAAEAEGIIFERQQIMLQLEKDTDLLGDIAAGVAPASQLPATARAVANGARDAARSFEDKVPGGRSKPEVWSNHADYMQRMQQFATATEAMAKLA